MKKVYSKPEIMFEDFSVSVNVASGCEAKTNLLTQNTCGIDFSGVVVFMEGMSGCSGIQVPPQNEAGDGEWNGVCYHTFLDDKNVFAS